MIQAVTVAITGIIVYLDTTAIAQLMICQPIIACPALGWMLGRPEIGLFFGIGFQLLWLGALPIGAAKFPEGNVAAIVATGVAARIPAASTGDPAWIVLVIATLTGILTAHAGGDLTPFIRRIMTRYGQRFMVAVADQRTADARWLLLVAVGIHAAAGLLLTLGGYFIGIFVSRLYLGNFATAGVSISIAEVTDPSLSGLWPALMGAGAAVVFLRFVTKRRWLWLLPGVALAGFWIVL